MKSLLASRPVLWFLFLFNFVVALAVGFILHSNCPVGRVRSPESYYSVPGAWPGGA
jgi:hypothetical protein